MLGFHPLGLEANSVRGPAWFLRIFNIWPASQVLHSSMLLLSLQVSATWPSAGVSHVSLPPAFAWAVPTPRHALQLTRHLFLTRLTHPLTSDVASLQKFCRLLSQGPQLHASMGPRSLHIVLTTTCFTIFVDNLTV